MLYLIGLGVLAFVITRKVRRYRRRSAQ